jgi:hypothetical protein
MACGHLGNTKAVDDGYVQVFSNDRGAMWLNQFDASSNNIAGGFSYMRVTSPSTKLPNGVSSTMCSAFKFGPQTNDSSVQYSRNFGIGYYNTSMTIANVVCTAHHSNRCLHTLVLIHTYLWHSAMAAQGTAYDHGAVWR